ncbi:MAG: DUF3987 domain-containing protein [Chlorobiales bacterium]|nr:DUF3987 domain-containing protein [Chlorobiales bacterium]
MGISITETSPKAKLLQDARVRNIAKQTVKNTESDRPELEYPKLKSAAPVFPLEVFPDAMQKMIREADERLNYGIAFTGCSLLFAAASAVGNSCVVQMNPEWLEGVTLWMALVGHPGTGKGHALKRVLKEIEHQDAQRYKNWTDEMKTYKRALDKFKRDKKSELVSDADEPEIPIWKKTILSDVTPQKMGRVHADNPRGICLHVDELAGWLQTFNRYNTGNAQKSYNTAWSRSPLIIDRVNSGSIRIEMPCIMVGGTIQPKILPELMAESRGDDGFTHRLLFCYPDTEAKPWNREDYDKSIFNRWDELMRKLLALPYEVEGEAVPQVLKFSPEAKAMLHDWQSILTKQANLCRSAYIKGIYAKIGHYAIRLSLIVQMIRYAHREGDKEIISTESVGAAMKLAEYFKASHLQIYDEIDSHSPLDDLANDKLNLYNALPEQFKKSDGATIADKMGIASRTFDRFVRNKTFFKKKQWGAYEKQI